MRRRARGCRRTPGGAQPAGAPRVELSSGVERRIRWSSSSDHLVERVFDDAYGTVLEKLRYQFAHHRFVDDALDGEPIRAVERRHGGCGDAREHPDDGVEL